MMTFREFREFAESHRGKGRHVIPVYRRLSADLLTPVSAFLVLRQSGRYAFLLESVEGGEHLARYSFLGKDPYRIVRARGANVEIEGGQGTQAGGTPRGDIFSVLQHYLQEYEEVSVPGLPRLRCGAVGFLGYDGVRLIEHLPDMPEDELGVSDAIWCFYDTMAAFDRVRHQMVLMTSVFVRPDRSLKAQLPASAGQACQIGS